MRTHVLQFGQDWGRQRLSHGMVISVDDLYSQGMRHRVFLHRGKGKEGHELYLGRFPVLLTLSMLTGQTVV